jgi:aminomethyltransferase
MPIPSPFHPRTSALCTSLRWKDWAGYHAVCSYDTYHEREYFAFRHAAGLMDVTPLFKYDVNGPDAATFLARVMVRDVSKLKVGQVTYCCWCDERGKLLDDGTVWRIDEQVFRVTAAEPCLAWFHRNARGLDVDIADVTERIAACSLQGPRSREILQHAVDADVEGLRFFRLTPARIDGFDAIVTRTGYTGDLGFEVWVDNEHACAVWDVLMEAGRPHGLLPAGLDALDMTRVEAGFIMNGVDYFSANHCLIESRMSTPDEAGLGWTVKLDRDPFVGQAALRAERERGPSKAFVGLEVDWDELAALYEGHGLPPEVCASAWREAVPVYAPGGRQVGQATSGSWSPTLKRNLALATVASSSAAVGTELRIEVTVEYVRHRVRAIVRDRPFFDPPRKRA